MSRSTCASASAASPLAFSAGRSALDAQVADCLRPSRHRRSPGGRRRPLRAFRCRVAARCRGCASAIRSWYRVRLRLLQRALGFLKLAFRLQDIGLRRQHGGVDFGDLAPGCFQRRLLLRIVQPEDHIALLDGGAQFNVYLRHPAVGFGKNGYGAIVQRRRRGRRMIVEDHRDQRDREHQAGDDAKSQLEPHRKERDLLADPLALPVAAIKIIREDGQQRTEEQFKHGPAPRSWRHRPSRCGPWPRQLRQRAQRLQPAARSGPVRAERRPSSRPIRQSCAAAC